MYDVIVVGARCAGSPTAMLLARSGYRVLVLDRAKFPSEPLGTPFIQQYGTALLESWGLLDDVRSSNCPPVPGGIWMINGTPIERPRDPNLPASYAPRRQILDKILVDAASAAGAEVEEGTSLIDLVYEEGRVAGVQVRSSRTGSVTRILARLVVGADGMHSLVARKVQAPAYNERPSYSCAYYTYWSGMQTQAGEVAVQHGVGALAFPSNDGLTCVAVGGPHAAFHQFRSDIEGTYMTWLELASPSLAERVRCGRREERWKGTADVPNFFRRPYGDGWALAGDAGYHKDPVTALGIADAFRSAQLLAESIDDGLSGRAPMSDALRRYQTRRDEAALPSYELTCNFVATLDASALERRSDPRDATLVSNNME